MLNNVRELIKIIISPGAWSPKSPKHELESGGSGLMSPTLRRCCLECPDDVNTVSHERRHSQSDRSDSSKDSSVQSDTSLDSEDSCISVIFVAKPGEMSKSPGDTTRKSSSSDKSIRSISNSSGSSDSPTGCYSK